ncbi:MAG: hypothetical protein ACON4T_10790 [Synechococcus sp.]
MTQNLIHRWIKTECGRAKYADLANRPGLWAKLRLGWFVLIASIRDARLSDSNLHQSQDSP